MMKKENRKRNRGSNRSIEDAVDNDDRRTRDIQNTIYCSLKSRQSSLVRPVRGSFGPFVFFISTHRLESVFSCLQIYKQTPKRCGSPKCVPNCRREEKQEERNGKKNPWEEKYVESPICVGENYLKLFSLVNGHWRQTRKSFSVSTNAMTLKQKNLCHFIRKWFRCINWPNFIAQHIGRVHDALDPFGVFGEAVFCF